MERIYDLIPVEESANSRAFHADYGRQHAAAYNQITPLTPRQYELIPLPLDYNRDTPTQYRLHESRDGESSLYKQALGYAALSATMIVAGATKNYIEARTGIRIFDSTAGMVGQGLAFLAAQSSYAEYLARIYGFNKTAHVIAKAQPWVTAGLAGAFIESAYPVPFDTARVAVDNGIEQGMQAVGQMHFDFPDIDWGKYKIPDWYVDVQPPHQPPGSEPPIIDMPKIRVPDMPKIHVPEMPITPGPDNPYPPSCELPDTDFAKEYMSIDPGATDKATGASLSGSLIDGTLTYNGHLVRTPENFMNKIRAFAGSDVSFDEQLIRQTFQGVWDLRTRYILSDQGIIEVFGKLNAIPASEVIKLWRVGNGNMPVSQDIIELAQKFGLIT